MSTGRMYPSATRLQDGTVLIAGGLDGYGGNTLNTALIYDPSTDFLTPTTGTLQAWRFGHTATLLQDGRVLIVGGRMNTGILASTEIYDPVSGYFTLSDTLTTGRNSHTATLLNDGRVLIAGGGPGVGVTDTFQVWDSGTFDLEGVMKDPRASTMASLLSDGTVLIAGGHDGAGWLETAEVFDPVSGTFSYTVGNMKLARGAHASIRLPSGEVLIAGGVRGFVFSPVLLSEAEIYDPITQTFALTDVLNIARSGPRATRLTDGRVLLVGGWEFFGAGSVPSAAAEIYDYGDLEGFFKTGSMGTARYELGATLLANGEVLVAGGAQTNPSPPPTILTTAERYDPIAGTFRPTGNLNQARYGFAETLLADGKVLIVGGLAGGAPGAGEVYDPNTGVFTPTSGISNAHLMPTATLLPSGKVLVFGAGGICPSPFAHAELFDPVSTTFTPTFGGPFTRRANHTATMLPNGKVLIAGGATCGSGGTLSSAELYDPLNDSFVVAGDTMSDPRYGHTASLLPSGEVLIAGGTDGTTMLSSAELYDPSTDTFYAVGTAMGAPRGGHFSALLPNGKVLIAGGVDDGSIPYSSSEVYDPDGNSFAPHFDMTTNRVNHSAVLLENGWVLVVGGFDGGAEIADAEIYLPGVP